MSGEKTEASMASLATSKTTPASSTLGVKVSTAQSPPPPPPPPTPSLYTAEASSTSPFGASSPPFQFSPNIAEDTTSDSTTASPVHLTPFPDLNFQTATLLTQLKNPSLLSTEELQSATTAANATLSAWKTEWLNIEATKRRGRGFKLTTTAHVGTRLKNAKTAEEEKESSWEDWNDDGEEAIPCGGKKRAMPKANRVPSAAREPPTDITTDDSSLAEKTSKEKEKADKAAKHSVKMREVWAKRRAEGKSGWKGGRPMPRTVEKWKKMEEKEGLIG